MSSNYLLESLHRQTATGLTVGVEDSFLHNTVRLVYRTRPDGVITSWQVEGPDLSAPAVFKTKEQAQAFIRGRWGISTQRNGASHEPPRPAGAGQEACTHTNQTTGPQGPEATPQRGQTVY